MSWRDPQDLLVLLTVPLYTVIFLAIFRNAGRDDLLGFGILAPVLLALWLMSLFISGEIIDRDRWNQTLELVLAAPAPFAVVIVGRIFTVTATSLLAFVEAWLVARLLFGVTINVAHPVVFVVGLGATSLAMSGTALIMSALFVLARGARIFQNSLSYPFYVLGGILVPTTYLPAWLQPLTKLVFLSWAADLLRDTLRGAPVVAVPQRVGMILFLGVAGFVTGWWLLGRMVDRVRALGTITYA
jgi:ABC-2 type transport system permease protein